MRKNKNGNRVKYNPDRGTLVSTYWNTAYELGGEIRETKTYVRHENNVEITEMYENDTLISTVRKTGGYP